MRAIFPKVSAVVLACLAMAVPAAQARTVSDIAIPALPTDAATIDVELRFGDATIWKGSLRLGAPHGNASYNPSKNEFAGYCGDERTTRNVNSNENLRLYVHRRYSPQEPDQFSVNVNWTRPVPACQGGGTDTFGLERPVILPPGGSATLSGSGDLVVRLVRRR